MKYRVFTNDISRHGYSALDEVNAATKESAFNKAYALVDNLPKGTLVLVIPNVLKSHWPSGKQGTVSPSTEKVWGLQVI
jgi:hypothetical protein